MNYDPKLRVSEEVGAEKHRQRGETFEASMRRQAKALADDQEHEEALLDIYLNRRFLNAGRVQAAAGSFRDVTAFNCFVSGTIEDSMVSIMDKAKEAALTMQKGGGIGYDFSSIRPSGAHIKSLDSHASGPLSFMEVFNSVCGTVASAGNRRGAQMGVLRVDHPDIEAFIEAKTNTHRLTNFNVSVGITDAFMRAVVADTQFDLQFEGVVYKTVSAVALWDKIMMATWDWAEPGVLFIDRINEENNLWYCETIAATNPCGEQPLPPYGACLLGSFNWAAYIYRSNGDYLFNLNQLVRDIPHIVRAMDNVIDRTIYPLPQQEQEARYKRRMGLGATGVANALEAIGFPYGTRAFLRKARSIQKFVTIACYRASIDLAKEKGSFPMLDRELFIRSKFMERMPSSIREDILTHGIRNSHLTSIAPTGSISLAADNVSSGIEPPFALEYDRKILMEDGSSRVEKVTDYGYRELGVRGVVSDELSPKEHVSVLTAFQEYIDSACSKTCNIGAEVSFTDFKGVYMQAWEEGAKGCTTFRATGKRMGILNAPSPAEDLPAEEDEGGAACYINEYGEKSCD